MKNFLLSAFSGIAGIIVTLVFQYFFAKPQSFTFMYDGNQVVVTESTYTELVQNNKRLEEQIQELQNQFEVKNSQTQIEQTIKDATEYWNNSDYVQALTLLKNSDVDSEDISAIYREYSEKYCADILEKTDALISVRKYDEATSLLTEAKTLVNDSRDLENKLTEINNHSPIKLSSLKISSSRFFELNNTDKPIEDSVGNRYSLSNLFITKAEGDSKYGYATFYLGKKYTALSGTIAVSDESENRSNQMEGWIEIYSKNGDEYNQLYISPMLSRMTSPIAIPEVNLEDSEWLEIRYYSKELPV